MIGILKTNHIRIIRDYQDQNRTPKIVKDLKKKPCLGQDAAAAGTGTRQLPVASAWL